MTKVFISYSRKDIEFARKLAASLSKAGIDVWIDVEDIAPGTNWSNTVNEGLKQSEIMLVIVSPTSMASTNVADEWQFYLNSGKQVIPIEIEDADRHYRLDALQRIDFRRQPYDEGLDQLLTALRKHLNLPPPGEEPDKKERLSWVPSLFQGRTILRTILVGILLVVGVAAFALLGRLAWSSWQHEPNPTPRLVADTTNVAETPVVLEGRITPSGWPSLAPTPLRPSDIAYTGAGVNVAILGPGVDENQPDLAHIQDPKDFTGTGINDSLGYGTAVAGIVAGTGAASDGRFKGMAPGASLHIAKVDSEHMIKGLDWARQLENMNIILVSVRYPEGKCSGGDEFSKKVQELTGQGIVVVASAGQDGAKPLAIGSPGCIEDVITVGTVDRSGSVWQRSGRGPTLDGLIKPDVVAPGEGVVTARAGDPLVESCLNENYRCFTGAGAASAYVAGVVALMLEANPELTPVQVKQILMATATDLGQDQNAQGAGLVNVHAALAAALSP